MLSKIAAILVWFGIFNLPPAYAQVTTLPIGTIQGADDVSPYLNRFVNFRGVVVGRYEDENTRGDVYYTLFVQSAGEETDDDPATSDGIAVFLGREERRDIPLGAQVLVGGKVTEFYGLTEIDDTGLVITIESALSPMPEPVYIDPPPDMTAQAVYFEALEGMRVAFRDPVIVAGPTHEGCGFAVIAGATAAELPAVRRAGDEPVGRVVPVLYPSDKECEDIPQVKAGDRISGMAGALVYNFDQFKLVFDSAGQLAIEPAAMPPIPTLPAIAPEQVVLASINAEDYFDTSRDTDEEGEPVLTDAELAARQAKLAHVIARVLNCPTLVGLQEVEHEALLGELVAALRELCGFVYTVSHLEGPDARGIDNALLSDPRRVRIDDVVLRQTCSPVPTGIIDASVSCAAGQEPLFGRPPLQIEALVDGNPLVIYVNHFKSKRGGEIETDLERIRQAVFLNELAAERLAADPATRLIALGDFNDTDLSPVMALLTDPAQGGRFINALGSIPSPDRYSYNFGGVVELIDAILLSPRLSEEVGWATIVHTNTHFPSGWRFDTSPERLAHRATDHDMPVVVLGQLPPTPEPTSTPLSPTPEPDPTPTTAPRPTDAPPEPAGSPLAAEPTPGTSEPLHAAKPETDAPLPWFALSLGTLFAVVIGGLIFRARR